MLWGVVVDALRRQQECSARDPGEKRGNWEEGEHQHCYLRDLSCLLRCSLLEKARLQNWHLYFFSGSDDFLICDDDAVDRTFMAAAGMFFGGGVSVRVLMVACWLVLSCSSSRSDGGIVWCASVGVGFKVRLDFVVVWCSFVVDFLSSMGVVVYCWWPVSRRGDGRVLAWARTAFAGRARREDD
jgi:hypothetical protein